MQILTKRNGVALVAVLAILLILTLLLPLMFTYSENAMESAMTGTDEQRSSYLARTMIEMSVAAFQDKYDESEEEISDGVDITQNTTTTYKLNKFYTTKKMSASKLYMYESANGVVYTTSLPSSVSNEEDLKTGNSYTVTYFKGDTLESVTGTVEYIGRSSCDVVYDDNTEYYRTYYDTEKEVYETEKLDSDGKTRYETYISQTKSNINSNTEVDPKADKYFKIEKKNVTFKSYADVNGKKAIRGCLLILPTKPSEQNWIVPANIESNQIFVDSSKATSVTTLSMKSSYFVDSEALRGQPVYIYSCVGNMVLSTEDLKIAVKNADGVTVGYQSYKDALASNSAVPAISDYSLGVHPETTTIKPEKDPNFSCLKTNNMRTWAKSAQRDNFVAFTATNGIEVDMKVNLIMNPCRTGRIGDGLSNNQSLYKVMYFQAPNIVFKEEVNTFISLYQKTNVISQLLGYNAYRMSSLVLAAPESTPHSYYHETLGRTVKAGKVYFMDDAYVWLVPFTENGSNYRTQTVYYKGKDIVLYKFANAGDVYLYNSEVETDVGGGQKEKAGFSMTNYFMDVLYNNDEVKTDNLGWWQFWKQMQNWIYNGSMETFRDRTYVSEDLKYIGNVGAGGAEGVPVVDDFYVIWDS